MYKFRYIALPVFQVWINALFSLLFISEQLDKFNILAVRRKHRCLYGVLTPSSLGIDPEVIRGHHKVALFWDS